MKLTTINRKVDDAIQAVCNELLDSEGIDFGDITPELAITLERAQLHVSEVLLEWIQGFQWAHKWKCTRCGEDCVVERLNIPPNCIDGNFESHWEEM